MNETDHLTALTESTRRYRETAAKLERARRAVIRAVIDALRAGLRPTDVVAGSPFTAAYVRKLAREHGIAPAPRGGRPRKSR